ncbi:MAG: ERF family protein, partial [Mycobacterium sp.]
LLYGDEKLDCGTVGASLDTRGKSAAQAVGSVVTYLRRYALSAIAGVAQEDDDGNYGGPPRNQRRQDPPRPQPAQRQQQAPPKPQQIPADACVVADLKARILPGKKETWADLDGSDKNREFLEKVAKGKHPKHELRNNVAMACAAARLIEIEEDDAAMRHAEDEDAKADPPVTDEPQF